MIEVFEGRIGGYKTYSAVARMVKYFATGGSVYTNIELKLDAVRAYLRQRFRWELQPGQYVLLTDEQIGEFHKHTPSGTPDCPVLVVLDEAHIWFNAREWNKTSRELLTFLTQSRKVATDIIFITQSMHNLDKQFMRLVQYVWSFRDLQKWAFKFAGFNIRWPLPQLCYTQHDYDGKTVIDRGLSWKDKGIYALYNTLVLLRTFPRLEAATDFRGKGKVKRSRWDLLEKAAGPFVLCSLLFAGGCRYVHVDDVRQKNAELEKRVQTLQLVLADLQKRISNSPASSVPAALSGAVAAPSVPAYTNMAPVLSAVVDGACGASNGRWYHAGEESPWGTVLVCDPARGRVVVSVNGSKSIVSL